MRVQRYDLSTYKTFDTTNQGYLRADAYATRAGIFTYILGDGSIRRELRHPDQVFHPDSLSSLAQVAVTNDHPPVPLDAENTRQYAVGFTGEKIDRVDDLVGVRITVTDRKTIDQIMAYEKREMSCGYTCDVTIQPGTFKGEEYDAIQQNIRYNHLAIVQEGRAGPEVKIKMDAKDGIMDGKSEGQEKKSTQEKTSLLKSKESGNYETQKRGDGQMAKIKIDSVEYEIQESIAPVIVAKLQKIDDAQKEIESKNSQLEKLKGRCDALEADLKAKSDEVEKVKTDSKISREEILKIGRARISLEESAKKILGDETKVDAMSDLDIQKAVITKEIPSVKLDGKSESYIEGMYDIVSEAIKNQKSDSFKTAFASTVTAYSDGASKVEKARQDAKNRALNQWKNYNPVKKSA